MQTPHIESYKGRMNETWILRRPVEISIEVTSQESQRWARSNLAVASLNSPSILLLPFSSYKNQTSTVSMTMYNASWRSSGNNNVSIPRTNSGPDDPVPPIDTYPHGPHPTC
jgi:hypothetical protein